MSQQGPSFDLSKVTAADKLILGGAGVYFIWSFMPFWYKFEIDLGPLGSGSSSISGFRGFTLLAALLALIAIAEIVVSRMMGTELKIPAKRGVVHLLIAGVALLCTLLGLVVKPTFYGISWGVIVAVIIAGVWAYGAYMLFSQPEAPAAGPAGGAMPPPPSA
jgi:hypothetical protein